MEEKYVSPDDLHKVWEYCTFDKDNDKLDEQNEIITAAKEYADLISQHFYYQFKIKKDESQEYLTEEFFKKLTYQMGRYNSPYKDFRGNIEWDTNYFYTEPEEAIRICSNLVRRGLMEVCGAKQMWIKWNDAILLYEFDHFRSPTMVPNVFYNIEVILLNTTHWLCYTYYSDKSGKRGELWFSNMLYRAFELIKFHNPTINKNVIF